MSARLCLIIGRGGSKRLPGKNLKLLGGKPLIAHSVEQALLSGVFATIAVSSDDDAILKAAEQAGANLLIKRPIELATDEVGSMPVIQHGIKEAEKVTKLNYDSVTLLQITSPLRLPEDIKKAIEIFEEKPVTNLISVTKSKSSPYYTIVEVKEGKAAISKSDATLIEKNPAFPETYDLNGSIYIWNKAVFMKDARHLYPDTRLMLMPALRSVDIDYKVDFDIAETIYLSGEYIKEHSSAVN